MNTILATMDITLKETWFYIPNWKWIGIAAAIIFGFSAQTVLRVILKSSGERLRKRLQPTSWGAFFLQENIDRPLAWALISGLWMFAFDNLDLPPALLRALLTIAQLILSLSLIHIAYLGASAIGSVIMALVRRSGHVDTQLTPFLTKTARFVVLVLGFLMMLQNFGINVMSIVAGLGLGGLALALAAQDTAANFFGSITILLDRPFKVGDFIKVADTEGTVEEIGFRSTRLRTPYNSLITIPNSTMAKEKIDNFQPRPTRRIRHTLGFTYDANQAQLDHFRNLLKQAWENHPDVEKGTATIVFSGFGDFSLNVLAQIYIRSSDWPSEMQVQQELLYSAMATAQASGLQFAFPTQTLHHLLPEKYGASPR